MPKLCRTLRLARTVDVYKEKSQVFILTVFTSAHVVNDFYVTVLPALSDEFNLNYGELGILSLTFTLLLGDFVGAVFGVSGLMSALAQPVVGTLAEQMGSVRGAL